MICLLLTTTFGNSLELFKSQFELLEIKDYEYFTFSGDYSDSTSYAMVHLKLITYPSGKANNKLSEQDDNK